MKRPSLFLFACLLTTSVVCGQTSQGNMMIGGTIGFNSRSYQGSAYNNSNEFRLTPSFGYFVKNDFALGLSLGFYNYRSGTDQARSVNTSFSLGPLARYYFFTSNEMLAFFGEAELRFGTDKSTQASGAVRHGNRIDFVLSPGVAYFFNEHWAAELSVGWLSVHSGDPDTDRDNDRYTSMGFSISSFSPDLGIRYHF